jgi:hypothetical protein
MKDRLSDVAIPDVDPGQCGHEARVPGCISCAVKHDEACQAAIREMRKQPLPIICDECGGEGPHVHGGPAKVD